MTQHTPTRRRRSSQRRDPAPVPDGPRRVRGSGVEHPDALAIELLSRAVLEGKQGLLFQSLVGGSEIATAAGGAAVPLEGPSLFLGYAVPAPDADVDDVSRALEATFRHIHENGIPQEMFNALQSRLMVETATNMSVASGIGNAVLFAELVQGGYMRAIERSKDLAGLSVGDIRRVAIKYLKPSNMTLLNLDVKPAAGDDGGGR